MALKLGNFQSPKIALNPSIHIHDDAPGEGLGIHSSDDALSHEGAINKREKFSPLLSRRRKVTPTTRPEPATHILGSSSVIFVPEAKHLLAWNVSPRHL